MISLYDFTLSGNCYKVRLMLALLGLEYKAIPVNLKEGEHMEAEFLKRHPFGKVPVLVDDNTVIWDSQAILVYLAHQYGDEDWLPSDAESMGKITQLLSVAAQLITESFAVARRHFLTETPVDIDVAQLKAYELLYVFENHLRDAVKGGLPLRARNWLFVQSRHDRGHCLLPLHCARCRWKNRAGCLSECSCMD